MIRRTLDPAEAVASGARFTDVVGTLAGVDEQSVRVVTRAGDVVIDRATIVAAREVPPRAERPGPPHLTIGVADLQRAMVGSWAAVEREALGDWLMRASSGFTNRGNSVVTTGSPGVPLEQAVDTVERWYATRALPAVLSLAGPVGITADQDPLGVLLLARGYVQHSSARVMTAATRQVPRVPSPSIRLSEELDDAWLEAYAGYRALVPGATEAILVGSPSQVFARAEAGGQVVGLARVGVAARWAGLAAVWVRPDHRRQGLARALTSALAAEAERRGLRSMHLQVEADNEPATTLYERLGFTVHHDYLYLRSTA